MSRILAVCSGGDWADASVTHVVVDDNFDLEKAKKEHSEYDKARSEEMRSLPNRKMWYVRVGGDGVRPYISLDNWILSHGGREPKESELEEVWEY